MTTRHPRRRDGLILLLLLLLLPGLFLFVVLVLSIDRGRRDTAELRNAGVSASLAAAAELASDDLLTADANRLDPLLTAGRKSAKEIAGMNKAGGKAVSLADADVVFGYSTQGFGGTFTPLNPTGPTPDWSHLNAVQVTTRLAANADKSTRVTAMFDTAVTGFRPTMTRSVPMVPFALYDGPTDATPPNVTSWSKALAGGTDQYQYTTATGPASGMDGLREVVVVIGSPTDPTSPPVVPTYVLNIGATESKDVTLAQIGLGVRPADLSEPSFGGEFSLLPDTMTKPVVGTSGALDGRLQDVADAFGTVIGQKRVWPLFAEVGDDGRPVVNGFVAARLLKVEYVSGGSAVRLTLQEAVLATPTAVTRPAPVTGSRLPPAQKSVGKVRLAG